METQRFVFIVAATIAISRIPAFAVGQASKGPNVVLMTPVQIDLVIPSVIGRPMVERHPLAADQVVYVAKKLLKAGPLYAVSAENGVALVPQNRSSLKKALFVPFKNNDAFVSRGKNIVKTFPLTKRLAGQLAAFFGAGNLFSAQMLLNDCFDKNWEKGQAKNDRTVAARDFFRGNTLHDLEKLRSSRVVSKVRDVKKLPAPLRVYLAGRKNRVVYAHTSSGNKIYVVFSSKSDGWGARGVLFGSNGDRLGTVKTRAALDVWEQDRVRAFKAAAGYTLDGGFPTFPGAEIF